MDWISGGVLSETVPEGGEHPKCLRVWGNSNAATGRYPQDATPEYQIKMQDKKQRNSMVGQGRAGQKSRAKQGQ